MPVKHFVRGIMAAAAVVLFASATSAQTSGNGDDTCVVVGKQVPKQEGAECPMDIFGTLRSYYVEYEEPKRDKDGKFVLDDEGNVVIEVKRITYTAMAQLLEDVGLKDAIDDGLVTVFAVPDSVLVPALKDLGSLLRDKERRQEVVTAMAMHVTDKPVMAAWFRSANGSIWTLAGNWSSGAAPLKFYALSDPRKIEVNNTPLTGSDIVASNGIIHTIGNPLVQMPKVEKEG